MSRLSLGAALLLGCASGGGSPAADVDAADADAERWPGSAPDFASAVVAEVDRLAAGELWPGFDPAAPPVAVYTGESTLLFRHPSPPEGFRASPERPGVWVHPGRHPAVTANTSVELGGVQTATVMLAPGPRSVRAAAALLAHELFHVFQRERHPEWSANEVDLFTYPVDAVEPLGWRRLETESLRRALGSGDPERARCWTRAALRLRDRRFSALPPEAAAYERGTELNEGLARYVEHRAAAAAPGEKAEERPEELLPERGFPPSAVRQRGYATGLALALLLDRFAPGWRRVLEGSPGATLDGLLAEAVGGDGFPACGFGPRERESAKAAAERDVAALKAERAERLRVFEGREGWRIVVNAEAAPLFPQGFDPLNVDVVGAGQVLHSRFLKLGNAAATVEVMGREALTVAAGEHPLFNGVRSLAVTGLTEEPTVTRTEGATRIHGEGVQIQLTGGEVVQTGRTIEVVLEP